MPATILGGKLHAPISLVIRGVLPIPAEEVLRNIEQAPEVNYPRVPVSEAKPHRLAIVGGGTSINDHVETLRNWPGDIWAINGAWGWCRDHGIHAWLFACDPDPIVLRWAFGATRAILSNTVDRRVFDMIPNVITYDCDGRVGGIVGRGSTATCAPHLGLRMGYLEGLTFFGCESCYPVGKTHAYFHENRTEEMLIEAADGNEYLTAPDFYIQATELSAMIRECPANFLMEESGGLLRAMVAEPEHHIRWVSDALAEQIQRVNQPAKTAEYQDGDWIDLAGYAMP